MKIKLIGLLLIFIVLIIVSCKKDDSFTSNENENSSYDTVYPGNYFPAYPGSYWVYSNSDTLKIEDEYELYPYNNANWQDTPDYDTVYLPKFYSNSIFSSGNAAEPYVYVYGYTISQVTYRLPFRTILSETLNEQFQTAESFAGYTGYGRTIAKDTTVEIDSTTYNDVIIVTNYTYSWSYGYFPWDTKEYYAKNIGLIKREHRNYPDTTAIYTDFILIDYFINH